MNLKKLRIKTGLTQERFAVLLGTNQQRLSELELGKRRLTGCHKQLVKAIEVLVDEWLLDKLR